MRQNISCNLIFERTSSTRFIFGKYDDIEIRNDSHSQSEFHLQKSEFYLWESEPDKSVEKFVYPWRKHT